MTATDEALRFVDDLVKASFGSPEALARLDDGPPGRALGRRELTAEALALVGAVTQAGILHLDADGVPIAFAGSAAPWHANWPATATSPSGRPGRRRCRSPRTLPRSSLSVGGARSRDGPSRGGFPRISSGSAEAFGSAWPAVVCGAAAVAAAGSASASGRCCPRPRWLLMVQGRFARRGRRVVASGTSPRSVACVTPVGVAVDVGVVEAVGRRFGELVRAAGARLGKRIQGGGVFAEAFQGEVPDHRAAVGRHERDVALVAASDQAAAGQFGQVSLYRPHGLAGIQRETFL
ncbi:hypothetical protein [Micromonospora sp. DPT]|uniref:hypothetical protein n=1 Tax=Micromonospora sp. DPT TaxID=3142975 RepID=UPI003208AFEF